jgi:hypothetical protein
MSDFIKTCIDAQTELRRLGYSEEEFPVMSKPVEELEKEEVLQLVKMWYADIQAQNMENIWRIRFAGVQNDDPLELSLRSASWAIKGMAAKAFLSSSATDFQKEIIQIEAGVMTSLGVKSSPEDVAKTIDRKFSFWVHSDIVLTAFRRATFERVYACETPEDCQKVYDEIHALALQTQEACSRGDDLSAIIGAIK